MRNITQQVIRLFRRSKVKEPQQAKIITKEESISPKEFYQLATNHMPDYKNILTGGISPFDVAHATNKKKSIDSLMEAVTAFGRRYEQDGYYGRHIQNAKEAYQQRDGVRFYEEVRKILNDIVWD